MGSSRATLTGKEEKKNPTWKWKGEKRKGGTRKKKKRPLQGSLVKKEKGGKSKRKRFCGLVKRKAEGGEGKSGCSSSLPPKGWTQQIHISSCEEEKEPAKRRKTPSGGTLSSTKEGKGESGTVIFSVKPWKGKKGLGPARSSRGRGKGRAKATFC